MKIQSEGGVHEMLTRGQWADWGCHEMVTRRHWAEWECREVVTKGRHTEWLVVMYSYINVLKCLYFLNYFDFLEFAKTHGIPLNSWNFLKFLEFP
jgi:hypothetical protein